MTQFEEYLSNIDLNSIDVYPMRDTIRRRYSFSIPNEPALNALKTYEPIIEVGCGSGYWAHEMRERKIDVVATDPHVDNNKYKFKDKWVEILSMDAKKAILTYPERTLFMSWPCYADPWSGDALKTYKGKYFILISEGEDGCVGGDNLWVELESNWKLLEDVEIPHFSGIHDYMSVYRRK